MSGHSSAQARPSAERRQGPSEADATSMEEDFGLDADIDEDVDLDEDSPEMDAIWIALAEEAEKEEYLSPEESQKIVKKCIKC